MLMLMLMTAIRLDASPYRHAQVLPGVDKHHTMIQRATKDPFGMVWMLSGGLISRFDGVSVTPLAKLYGKELPFYEADDLHADPWGRLWISTRNGLKIFDLNTWSFAGRDHPMEELAGRQVVSFFAADDVFYMADRRGNVWLVGERDARLLFRFDPYAVFERRPVGRLLVADRDGVWLAFGDNLYGYDLATGKQTVSRFPDGLFSRMEDLLPVDNGVLIRIYSQGYYVYDGAAFRALPRPIFPTRDFTNWNHWSFETDDKVVIFHETQYFEFSRDTLFRLLDSGTHQFNEHILNKRLNDWQQAGDEWLLSTDHGLYSVFPSHIAFDFVDCGSARGMIKQNGTYYFGGYGYLDALPDGGKVAPFVQAPENNYYAFLRLSADTACVALEGDFLAYLVQGNVSAAPVYVAPHTRETFTGMAYCVVKYAPDTLLVGTYNGLWTYARSTGEVAPLVCPASGFFSRGMRVQSISVHGNRIAFTADRGFFTWERRHFQKVFPAGNTELNIYAHVQRGDTVYLATKGRGLILIAGKEPARAITVEDGLASNTVYQMAWVGGALFLGTHEGLSVRKSGIISNYYHTDGLPFEEFNHQASYYDTETDRLFMGGIGGYVSFRPGQLLHATQRVAPQPRLSGVKIGMHSNRYVEDYGRMQLGDTLELPSDAVWFSMDFARPDSYRKVYRMQFKIAPLMMEYQDMPASAQINLSGLSAGEYEVSVKMAAATGGGSASEHTWLVYKVPVFTETLTFYVLVILFIGVVSGYIVYERTRKIKGEERLRRRISRDLHDEVGGLLTGISMQTDLLRLQNHRMNSVESIGAYSREAIQMMDDIIWAVDSRNNHQGNLSDRMKFLAAQLLEPLDAVVTFDIDQHDDRKISQKIRQNLYLIFKEALHNICKHSAATDVHIKLRHIGGHIEMEIYNDGVDRSQVGRPTGRRGHGQRNMQLRAAQLGATFTAGMESTGYRVSVMVPTRRAFFVNPFKRRS
ncbi:sensor histidine kinase [Parapedobacter soli]|uniref:sensor histidine kinase n=1 Tax=Parapedobacter soli TaxID=416955 RepID=UPI0021C7BC59|nr:histidine kinase [Parapedobacter soli]